VVLVMATSLAACAVNDFGLTRVHRFENDSTSMIRLETWGAHLLTAAGDAGLSVGYARRTYVYRRGGAAAEVPLSAFTERSAGRMHAVDCNPCAALSSLGKPVFRAAEVVGLAIETNADRVGVAIGLRQTAALRLPSDGNETILLKYSSDGDESPQVIIAREVEP
jgi:hypothetical protein